MTGADHRKAMDLAQHAEVCMRRARVLYAEAAEFEARALVSVPADKPRTFGILAVSAAALWYKARGFDDASGVIEHALADHRLSQPARAELLELREAIEQERSR